MIRIRPLFAAAFLGATVAARADSAFAPLPLEGDTFSHDPSTILQDHGRYFLFYTGRGILSKSSADLVHWSNGPSIFNVRQAWTTNDVPGFDGVFWAPDSIRLNGKFYLYYSVSTFGKQVSAIGLATNPTLDPASPDYHWTDHGPIIRSDPTCPYNTIDPSVMLDTDGKLWLSFGSYWKGIHLTELDSKTGQRRDTNAPPVRLAWNDSIEASCLTRHGDFYYLFVNWGSCCQGVKSTYEVRVGRSKTITGPYLDRDGKDLVDGGGTLFIKAAGRYIGPGHIGIVNQGATNLFSFHYYDAETKGRPRFAIGQLNWKDGWPTPVKD